METAIQQSRKQLIEKTTNMFMENTGYIPEKVDHLKGNMDYMFELLEKGDAFIQSSVQSGFFDRWLIVETENAKILRDKKGKAKFGMVVMKGEPYEKEIIDTFFSIKRSKGYQEVYQKLVNSPIFLNF